MNWVLSPKEKKELRQNTLRLQGLTQNSSEVYPGCWQPSRPATFATAPSLWQRLCGAWLVLVGKAQFIRWYR